MAHHCSQTHTTLYHQSLKAPLVKVERREKNAKVDVTIRVPKPMYEFYSRVRSITVSFKSTHGADYKMKMRRCDIVKPLETKRESELILPRYVNFLIELLPVWSNSIELTCIFGQLFLLKVKSMSEKRF
jgi:hypothetical protein